MHLPTVVSSSRTSCSAGKWGRQREGEGACPRRRRPAGQEGDGRHGMHHVVACVPSSAPPHWGRQQAAQHVIGGHVEICAQRAAVGRGRRVGRRRWALGLIHCVVWLLQQALRRRPAAQRSQTTLGSCPPRGARGLRFLPAPLAAPPDACLPSGRRGRGAAGRAAAARAASWAASSKQAAHRGLAAMVPWQSAHKRGARRCTGRADSGRWATCCAEGAPARGRKRRARDSARERALPSCVTSPA